MAIWESVLGLASSPATAGRLGIRDHFFALGGHSLLAIQLLTRLQAQVGRPLPLNLLLQYPTVEALAAYLTEQNAAGDAAVAPSIWSPLVTLQPAGSRAPFFCLPGVEGIPTAAGRRRLPLHCQ